MLAGSPVKFPYNVKALKQVLIRRGMPIVADVPAPPVADNTILVEVAFSLISTGTETAGMSNGQKSLIRQAYEQPAKIVRGLQMVKETGLRRTVALIEGEMESSFPTGYACSGRVVTCGRNVHGFAPGDLVACAGANRANHAELVAVPANLVVRVPDSCDLESAASATIGAIALQGVRRTDVRLGESVAVVGLGLIGQITVQLLKAAGCRIIGTDIDPARTALALSAGINIATPPDGLANAVSTFTEGRGVDAVIITASSESATLIQEAMQIVRKKGKVVVVGAVPLQLDRSPFYEKEADLLISCSYGPGRYDPEYEELGHDYPYGYVRWTENRNMAEYLKLIADGKIDFRSLIGKIWPLTEAPQAYSDLKQNKHVAVLLSNPLNGASDAARVRTSIGDTTPVAGLIRTGIIGAGSFARSVHLPNLQRLKDRFAISAIASRTGVTALNAGKQYGSAYISTAPDELFQDSKLDLILIASRHDQHASQAIRAAEQHKAVLLEKPAAMNRPELDELLRAFRKSGNLLVVGFNRRFSPLIQEVKSLVEGRLSPVLIQYRMNAGFIPLESWIHGPEGGGRIIGEACHIFDLFNYLVGVVPETVTALSLRPGAAHISGTDNFVATLRYTDGSLCTLTYTSRGSTDLPKEAMEVFVDGKSVVLHDYRRLEFFGCSRKPTQAARQEKGHFEELVAVADYLVGKGPLPMTLEEIEAATNASFIVDELVRSLP
jgi:predicted dehydrogenase/threonine dehydrogenase-like Zn-dependent dehydrogenase